MERIEPIKPTLSNTYQYIETLTKVVTTSDNKRQVVNTHFVITLYEMDGKLTRHTNVHTVDYLV